jgi:hypothetical protein
MIKGLTTTVVSACLAGGVGIGLFFVKHEVKEQEIRLADLNMDIQRNQEAIHVLKAEWSYLNDPARLRQLSEKFLGMRVMGPSQITTLASLPRDAAPALAHIVAPAAPAPAKAEPAPAAKPDAPKMAAPRVLAPKVLAKAGRDDAYRPEPKAPPAQPASVPSAAPPAPARSIVIQSPAIAQTQAPIGEVR